MTPPSSTPSSGQLDATLQRMDYGRALKETLLMTSKSESWVPYAQPLLDAVALFDELGIGYALVGGIAAMHYGRARFTEDVDFVAATGHMDVLAAHSAEMEKHHFESTCTYKLSHISGVQVDLWKDEHADGIVQRAQQVQLAGHHVRIADPYDLIAMKLRARRLKDDYDIAEIAKSMPIDRERLASMVTSDQLAGFDDILKRA